MLNWDEVEPKNLVEAAAIHQRMCAAVAYGFCDRLEVLAFRARMVECGIMNAGLEHQLAIVRGDVVAGNDQCWIAIAPSSSPAWKRGGVTGFERTDDAASGQEKKSVGRPSVSIHDDPHTKEVLRLRSERVKIDDIAAHCKITSKRVRDILQAHGVPRIIVREYSRKMSNERLTQLRGIGLTNRQIATICGVCAETVGIRLSALDIALTIRFDDLVHARQQGASEAEIGERFGLGAEEVARRFTIAASAGLDVGQEVAA